MNESTKNLLWAVFMLAVGAVMIAHPEPVWFASTHVVFWVGALNLFGAGMHFEKAAAVAEHGR